MIRSLIVAADENNVIGKDNDLPWPRIPADMRWFRDCTMGHSLIMGRRTWDSIGAKPLPGRRAIVMTRQRELPVTGAEVAHSMSEAWQMATGDEVFVLGGSQIFVAALPDIERIYFTRIHAEFEGDTLFPPFPEQEFAIVEQIERAADERNRYDLTFLIYERAGRGKGSLE